MTKEAFIRNPTALRAAIVDCFRDLKTERILLFGSWAAGRADADSDIDLILVVRSNQRFLDRLKEAYLRWTLPLAVDILVYTPTEFQLMRDEENPLICDALAHGVTLYEKSDC